MDLAGALTLDELARACHEAGVLHGTTPAQVDAVQSRHAWERDRRREREAHARGDEFRRYTYGDVFEHPYLMLRELRGLLPRRRPV